MRPAISCGFHVALRETFRPPRTSKACLDTRAILGTIAQAVKEQTSKSNLRKQTRFQGELLVVSPNKMVKL